MKRLMAGLGLIAALAIGGLTFGQTAEARSVPHWYCSTTTTDGQPCIPDPTTTVHVTTTYPTTTAATTTQATTTIATTTTATTIATTTTKPQETTTVPQTTTTVGSCAPLCAGQNGSTTTVPQTTTTVAKTTTTLPVSVAPTTVAPTTIPDTTAVDQTVPATVPTELPHTGAQTDIELALAGGLLFLGWLALVTKNVLHRKP